MSLGINSIRKTVNAESININPKSFRSKGKNFDRMPDRSKLRRVSFGMVRKKQTSKELMPPDDSNPYLDNAKLIF